MLYERDGEGTLVPKEVELELDEDNMYYEELKGQKIFVIPLTRGELKKFFADIDIINAEGKDEKDFDADLILKHCSSPKFTDKEVSDLKPAFVKPIVDTILRESGMGNKKEAKKNMEKADEDFEKN